MRGSGETEAGLVHRRGVGFGERLHEARRKMGAGVPLAIAEQIGKPFFTTKGKGFGLGLFLSKASVTRAGGSVKHYSHEEGGTLTELRLPRVARGDIDE